MPKQKDLKRLIRARMEKTGESYTTARAHLTESDGNAAPFIPPGHEELAGMSDEAVAKATGNSWPEWLEYLDDLGALHMKHPEIASHLDETFSFGGWWAQSVTVGYERLRGLRDVGQRRGGDYDMNRSRTFQVPIETLWDAFEDAERRARWMGKGQLEFHRTSPHKSMRGTTDDGYKVALYFTDKSATKCSVSIQISGLPDRESVEALKSVWGDRLDGLKSEVLG